jgi:NADPH:quinone reductase-like Zn-dependent oxidoreductase
MPRAVRFNEYGDPDVLHLVEVEMPVPSKNQVMVEIKAAGINPGEGKIRQGIMRQMFPITFPSGEGSDFAGIIRAAGPEVTKFQVGDAVAGFSNEHASHAEYVVVPENQVALKPATVPWEVAGALFVAGSTAYAAVRAVSVKSGDKVIVSGAGGGVGSIAAQLAIIRGAAVVGIAGDNDQDWLMSRRIVPISYSGDIAAKLRKVIPDPDAFIDTVGKGYVTLALDLGIKPERIDTIIDFAAAEDQGVKAEGSAAAASAAVLTELLEYIGMGKIEVPVAKTFPLTKVQDAYRYLENEHHRGKVVLLNAK